MDRRQLLQTGGVLLLGACGPALAPSPTVAPAPAPTAAPTAVPSTPALSVTSTAPPPAQTAQVAVKAGGVVLPTYIRERSPRPDFLSTGPGIDDGYKNFP